MTASTPSAPGTRRVARRPDSWVLVRLALLAAAVLGALAGFWPPLTLACWLLAAAGVVSALWRPAGRDAVDRIARGVGLPMAAVVLLGAALNALAIPLTPRTWASTLGVVGAVIVVGAHLHDRRVTPGPPQALPAQRQSVADAIARRWRDVVRRPGATAWLLTAAAMVVAAVSVGVLTEPRTAPDLELSLNDPAVASTAAASVRVTITAGEAVDTLLLRVQNPDGTTDAGQRFSIGAGQRVERVVTLAATGASRILLTSPGRGSLDRTLTVNR